MTNYQRGMCFSDERGRMVVLTDEDGYLEMAEKTNEGEWISWRMSKNKFKQLDTTQKGQIHSEKKMDKIKRLCAADPEDIKQVQQT